MNDFSFLDPCIIIGLVFFFLGLFFLFYISRMIPKSDKESTIGYLVDYIEGGTEESSIGWNGVYEYKVNEEIYRYTSAISSSDKSLIKKEIKIDYNKKDPSINRTNGDFTLPIMFCIGGIIVFLIKI